MNNDDDEANNVAKANEVGIFINADNDYRIVIPKGWQETKEMPRFPYLVVAAVLRMAEDTESSRAFARDLFVWAEEHVAAQAHKKDTSAHQADWANLTNLTRH